MTFFVLILLVVIAVSCAALKWWRTGTVVCAALAIYVLSVGCGPLAGWFTESLQSGLARKQSVAWGDRNVIVVLGAGAEKIAHSVEPAMFSYARVVEAARLYSNCRKTNEECKLLLSGGDASKVGLPEAEIYKHVLLGLGIDASDVMLESASLNTWQNAQFASQMLKQYDANRVVLVTSGIHMRRSLLYFEHFGVSAIPVRADYLSPVSSVFPLAYNFAITDFAIHEHIGIARYYLYNMMGWNPPKMNPGPSVAVA